MIRIIREQRWGLTVPAESIDGSAMPLRWGDARRAPGRFPRRNGAGFGSDPGENKLEAATEHNMPMCPAGRRRRPHMHVMSGHCASAYIAGLRPNPTRHARAGRVVRRQAEVVAHQLSHTPQVDSIFNVPAGKDNLYADLYVANDCGYIHFSGVICGTRPIIATTAISAGVP
jgi:hypothetical protein